MPASWKQYAGLESCSMIHCRESFQTADCHDSSLQIPCRQYDRRLSRRTYWKKIQRLVKHWNKHAHHVPLPLDSEHVVTAHRKGTDRCGVWGIFWLCNGACCCRPLVAWGREVSVGFGAASYMHPYAYAYPGTQSSTEVLSMVGGVVGWA